MSATHGYAFAPRLPVVVSEGGNLHVLPEFDYNHPGHFEAGRKEFTTLAGVSHASQLLVSGETLSLVVPSKPRYGRDDNKPGMTLNRGKRTRTASQGLLTAPAPKPTTLFPIESVRHDIVLKGRDLLKAEHDNWRAVVELRGTAIDYLVQVMGGEGIRLDASGNPI